MLRPAWKRLGVLIPSKISASGEFENGYIGLHNNQFGPLENLKGDGVARVRCRMRNKCERKASGGRTNQGRIKRSGWKFEWIGDVPQKCCTNPSLDMKNHGKHAGVIAKRRLEGHIALAKPGSSMKGVMIDIQARTPASILDEAASERMRNTLSQQRIRTKPCVKPVKERQPINADELASEGDDMEAIQKKIKQESFRRQMEDLRENRENVELRKCSRAQLDPVTYDMTERTTNQLHIPCDQIKDDFAMSQTPAMRAYAEVHVILLLVWTIST